MNAIRSLLIACMLCLVFSGTSWSQSESAHRFSILTCSPGPELYTVFGHAAIRYQDTLNGHAVDWVYNYGTFRFDDSFYLKFARGRLDYMLSKADMDQFMEEYQYFGRGVVEQVLELDTAQEAHLFQLLETNYLPENRVYRYDFFTDNCSSRIRDMIQQSLDSSIRFTYVPPRTYSFREGIQNYLDYMPWSDFGIDLALGLPCDRKMKTGEDMFLPDSLRNEFHFAMRGNDEVCQSPVVLLPRNYELQRPGFWTPLNVFMIAAFLQIALGWMAMKRGRMIIMPDRIFFFMAGFIGLVLVALWFFTDHHATKYNLNILWANPLYLILAFSGWAGIWQRRLYMFTTVVTALALVGFFVLPQSMHLATLPIMLALVFAGWKTSKRNSTVH